MVNTTSVKTLLAELNKAEMTKYLPLTIALVVVMCLGIVGNIIVIYIYKVKHRLSSARVYILCLAVSDLIVCLFGIPYHVLDLTLILTYTQKYMCKVLSFLIASFTFCSVFILLVVSIDRYLKVCRPLGRQVVDFGNRKACLLAVCIAFVLSVPNAIIYGKSSVDIGTENVTGSECFIDDDYQGSEFALCYMVFLLLLVFVCTVILIILYAFMCKTICKNYSNEHVSLQSKDSFCCCSIKTCEEEGDKSTKEGSIDTSKELHNTESSSESHRRNDSCTEKKLSRNSRKLPVNKRKSAGSVLSFSRRPTLTRHFSRQFSRVEENSRKITLMMMTITFVFITVYLPLFVISIMDILDETLWDDLTETKEVLYDLLLRLYIVNNAANPVIYSFWDVRFRKETVLLFKRLFCCTRDSKKTSYVSKTSLSSRISIQAIELP